MTPTVNLVDPITEDWLKAAGFKWHQLERQPDKHWLLWLGSALNQRPSFTGTEDLGIELAPGVRQPGDVLPEWFCWLRSDCAGRYHRFIHVRHLTDVGEVVALVEAITGRKWEPANNLYGSMHSQTVAAHIRQDRERLDRRMMEGASDYQKWSGIEKDDTRGRALPEHYEAHENAKGPKK
jgi:hypothetical protein